MTGDLDIAFMKYTQESIYVNYDTNHPDVDHVDVHAVYQDLTGSRGRWRYFYGPPRQMHNMWSLVNIFPVSVWAMILVSVVLSFAVMEAARRVYLMLPSDGFVNGRVNASDILLKVFASLTEPDPMPFFRRWSAG